MKDELSRRSPVHRFAAPETPILHITHPPTRARRLLTSLMLLVGLATPPGALTGVAGAGVAGAGVAGLAAALVLSPRTTNAASSSPGTAAQVPAARVIVRFKSDTSLLAGHARALAARPDSIGSVNHAQILGTRHGLSLSDGFTVAPFTQVITATGISSADLANRLSSDSDVDYAVPDQRRYKLAAPNDPLYPNGLRGTTPVSGQWYLRAPTTVIPSSVDAEAAWAITVGSPTIVVADLDTGVRRDHPDLAGKLLPGYDFISDIDTSNDRDGRDADPSDPGDWITSAENSAINGPYSGCSAPDPSEDSSWHGTQTAGLIGAVTNNGVGMASLGQNIMVLPIRVLGKCGGFDSDIIAAMQWAAGIHIDGVPDNSNPARIVNLSLGSAAVCAGNTGRGYIDAIAALAARKIAVVVSAGNDSRAVNMPANCKGAIAVGGLRHAGTKNGFASLGPEVAISAPAGNCVTLSGSCEYPIISTANTGTTTPLANSYTTGGIDAAIGTSFSAPLVSATLALALSVNPALDVSQLRSLARRTSRSFANAVSTNSVPTCVAPALDKQEECKCTTATCGAGMLDAGATITAASFSSPVAAIEPSATSIDVNQSVTLDGSGSTTGVTKTITSYTWQVINGSNLASIVSGSAASMATLSFTGSGNVVATLTVRDSAGSVATSQQTITVTGTPSDKTSGGGAMDASWLAGLALAAVALARRRRHAAN